METGESAPLVLGRSGIGMTRGLRHVWEKSAFGFCNLKI
jgi:hypothetical protein